MNRRRFLSRNTAFTLVELLVVIGIVTVLISLLMPTLAAARRSVDRARCSASLRQIGNAFVLYSMDNRGYWPMTVHQWKDPGDPAKRDKRWNHFLTKYLIGKSLNEDGLSLTAADAELIGRTSPLWGCPKWDTTTGSALNFGYAMNFYPFAPDLPALPPTGYSNVARQALVVAPLMASASDVGWYYKAVHWRRPAERALVFDCIASQVSLNSTWPYTLTAMPPVPNAISFNVDFNRHGPTPRGNKETAATINMLFCDGHADTVSARDAFKAIRFK